MGATEMWQFRESTGMPANPVEGVDLTGYRVEATDGAIGHVDEATYAVGSSRLVVDTGPWILGKKVMLPAGVVVRVDLLEEAVHIGLTRDQVKDSPRFGEAVSYEDETHRDEVSSYFYSAGDW